MCYYLRSILRGEKNRFLYTHNFILDLDEILGDLDTQSEDIKEDKNWITPTVENKAQLEKDPVARSKLDLQEEQSQEPIPFYR